MKLYRIQNKKTKKGLWNGGLLADYRGKCSNYYSEKARDMSDELHAPRGDDYDLMRDDYSDGKFYFKESFWMKYKDLFDDIRNAKIKKFELIEINLEDVKKYTMYYQDIDQCFLVIE